MFFTWKKNPQEISKILIYAIDIEGKHWMVKKRHTAGWKAGNSCYVMEIINYDIASSNLEVRPHARVKACISSRGKWLERARIFSWLHPAIITKHYVTKINSVKIWRGYEQKLQYLEAKSLGCFRTGRFDCSCSSKYCVQHL